MQIPSMTVIPELAHRLVSVSIAQGPLLTLNRTSTTLRGRHRLIQYQLTTTIVSPYEMWLERDRPRRPVIVCFFCSHVCCFGYAPGSLDGSEWHGSRRCCTLTSFHDLVSPLRNLPQRSPVRQCSMARFARTEVYNHMYFK